MNLSIQCCVDEGQEMLGDWLLERSMARVGKIENCLKDFCWKLFESTLSSYWWSNLDWWEILLEK